MNLEIFPPIGLSHHVEWQGERPKPWRLSVVEPLATKAPGPSICQAYCCYMRTVIFYAWPYRIEPPINPALRWYVETGKVSIPRPGATGSFVTYDEIDLGLSYTDAVRHDGELWEMTSGRVEWRGPRDRWVCVHELRRLDTAPIEGMGTPEKAYENAIAQGAARPTHER